MKIILLQDVRGTGRKYEVKDVPDGYARNFLIAKGFAETGTQQALAALAVRKARLERDDVELKKHLEERARFINDHSLEFTLKTDEKGSVFGSITKEMILRAMREHSWLGKERVDIALDHPIKKIGDHQVAVDLKKDIRATLSVIVRSQP